MPYSLVLDLARNTILTALMLSGPLLVVALATGLVISVIQAVTQIQEQTLSFVPKFFAVAIAFLVMLSWGLQMIVRFTVELFRSFPTLIS